jgi:deazaflavin-dependent oxidoreductase (nitroreductase family)
MTADVPAFREPSRGERLFNRLFGVLVGLGLGARHNHLVQVRGRTTGRVYSTPVNLLALGGRRFLVAPRGRTQWVRNAEAAGEVALKRGARRRTFRVRALPAAEKPDVLQAYLDRFRLTVQRYFPVPAGSDPARFRAVADRYPVFELLDGPD